MKSGGKRHAMPPPNPGSRVEYSRQEINPKKQVFKHNPETIPAYGCLSSRLRKNALRKFYPGALRRKICLTDRDASGCGYRRRLKVLTTGY